MESIRHQYPIQARKIIKKTFGTIFWVVLISVVIAVVVHLQGGVDSMSTTDKTGIAVSTTMLVVIITFLIWNLFYQYLYFRSYQYACDKHNIQIRKGVVTKNEITLPFDRITDLYVDQDILDRLFGLYDLHFSTATASSSMEAHIDGLDRTNCEKLKVLILNNMNASTKCG